MTHFTQSQASLPVYHLGEKTKWRLFFLFFANNLYKPNCANNGFLSNCWPILLKYKLLSKKGIALFPPTKVHFEISLKKEKLMFSQRLAMGKEVAGNVSLLNFTLNPVAHDHVGYPCSGTSCSREKMLPGALLHTAPHPPPPPHTHCPSHSASLSAWTTANPAHLTSLSQSTVQKRSEATHPKGRVTKFICIADQLSALNSPDQTSWTHKL